MRTFAMTLARRLWNDDCGAVLTTEYLALGSIVVLGSIGGMTAMRDATVDEMQEYSHAVRNLNQSYSYPGMQSGMASKGGAAVSNQTGAGGGGRGAAPANGYTFSPPADALPMP
jgi:hypothetical protein